jgi:hypothetical protein
MTIKLDYQTVKNFKSAGRYTDALIKGLHVWVKPNGKKYWIFRYNFNNKQHNISLGSFSAMTANDPMQTLADIYTARSIFSSHQFKIAEVNR